MAVVGDGVVRRERGGGGGGGGLKAFVCAIAPSKDERACGTLAEGVCELVIVCW